MKKLYFIIAVFVLYSLSLFGEFHFDDYAWIHYRVALGNDPMIPGRPIPSLLLNFLYNLGGLNPFVYKLTNIILHCSVVGMLFALSKQLGRASWGVYIFAIHPVFVSTVAYPIQASVMLATLACGWAFYLRKESVLCAMLCFVACLCKQNAYVFPLCILVYVWLKRYSVAWLLLAGAGILNWYVLTHDMTQLLSGRLFTPWTRMCTQGSVLFNYLDMILCPVNQYSICHEVEVISHFGYLIAWLAIVLLLLYKLGKGGKCIVLSFLIMMLPESSILSLDLCFEHRLYLPCAILAMSVSRIEVRKGIVWAVVAWLLIVNVQTQVTWLSQKRMWEHTLEMYPNNWRAHKNLAVLINKTNPILSLYHFNEALKIDNRKTREWNRKLIDIFKYAYAPSINDEVVEFNKKVGL